MPRRTILASALLALSVAVLAVACGSDDDGAAVRSETTSATGSGSGSASGSASGTGLSLEDTKTATTDDPEVLEAVTQYKAYVEGQVDELIAATTVFTDAVRAGDLPAAKAAYAPSREAWERIEPIAGLISDIDGAVDSRVDDFAGPTDPTFTGWHRLEYLLFEKNTTEGAAKFADGLDEELAGLKTGLAKLGDPAGRRRPGRRRADPGGVRGQDHRRGGPLLEDGPLGLRRQRRGLPEGHRAPHPGAREADPDLLASIQAGFSDLQSGLAPLRKGDGWVLFCPRNDEFPSSLCPNPTVTPVQIARLKAQLGGLSENLALVPGALGLS